MTFLTLAIGLALLAGGGEALVRGASALAQRAGVSPLLIGLTLVGFGSSTPELVTSVQAAMIGSPGIALGNIVGSNTANILLILGVAGLLMPMAASGRTLARDGGVVLGVALLAWALAAAGWLGRPAGAAMAAALVGYMTLAWLSERRPGRPAGDALAAPAAPDAEDAPERTMGLPLALGFAVAGLVMVVLGGRLLVLGAVELARGLGVAETVIGLSVVAIGTSLPELVTSLVAAIRKQGDIALGNVLGSNIYNILGIGGLTALIAPVEAPAQMLRFDFPVMVGATVLMLVFLFTGRRLARWEAAIFLALYAAYMAALWLR